MSLQLLLFLHSGSVDYGSAMVVALIVMLGVCRSSILRPLKRRSVASSALAGRSSGGSCQRKIVALASHSGRLRGLALSRPEFGNGSSLF